MPLTHREVLQLGLLLLCVPAQYLLSGNFGTGTSRSQAVLQLVNELKHIRESWFNLESWKNMWYQFISWILKLLHPSHMLSKGLHESAESPAIEVLQYREREGHFATSPAARAERPLHLRFRVGQVVRHRVQGYRGVIIGWDLQAKAPKFWLQRTYGDNKMKYNWPHYAILIDKRDQTSFQATYVIQDQLEVLKNTEIQHPEIYDYFEYFDGAQYIPQRRLRGIYPKD